MIGTTLQVLPIRTLSLRPFLELFKDTLTRDQRTVPHSSCFDTNNFELLLSLQKLENKLLQKLKFSKNVNNEKCAPKMLLLNEKNKLERFKCRGPEVVPSSLYQKNIGVEFTHLYKQIKKFELLDFIYPR